MCGLIVCYAAWCGSTAREHELSGAAVRLFRKSDYSSLSKSLMEQISSRFIDDSPQDQDFNFIVGALCRASLLMASNLPDRSFVAPRPSDGVLRLGRPGCRPPKFALVHEI
jgi:hypothetical protein